MISNAPVRPARPVVAPKAVRPVAPAAPVRATAPKKVESQGAVRLVSKVSGFTGGALGGATVGATIAAITTRSLGGIGFAAMAGLAVGGLLGGYVTGKLGGGLDDATGGWLSKLAFTGFWGTGEGFWAGLKSKIFGAKEEAAPAPTAKPAEPAASGWTVKGVAKQIFWFGNVPPGFR